MLDFFLLEGECQEHTHRRRAAQEKVKEPGKNTSSLWFIK